MSSSSNTTTNIINPKPCVYNCNTRIYWDTSQNAFLKYSVRNVIYVLIVLAIQNQQQLQQQLVTLNPHIITKNPGPILNNQNQRCLIHLNYCRVQLK